MYFSSVRADWRLCAVAIFVIALSWGSLRADVRLNGLFCDGMVLQRDMPVPVFGRAERGERITIEIAGQTKRTAPDFNGYFKVLLDPIKAGGPYELKITAKNTILIKDVLVGEVWLCSGQSNMAMEVQGCLNAREEIAAANYPQIRQFQVKRGKAATAQDTLIAVTPDQKGLLNAWVPCTPATAGSFTGVGYFFAREIHKRLGVPVGLIHSSWGGTTAEAWTCECIIENTPALKSILTDWPKYNNDEDWLKEQYAKFEQEKKDAREAGKPEPLYFNQPSVLFNAMICPLMGYSMQGALWYQGESNIFRAFQYRDLLPAMVQNWRSGWEREFPFLIVQLANFEAGAGTWAELREAQLMAMSRIPNSAMIVATDVGEANDIHPKNKQEVGRRLALAARATVYGETALEWSGPLYGSMSIESKKIRISFEHAGEGLVTRDGKAPAGLLIAGADQKFVPAEAKIEGRELVVWSEAVKAPAAVRYAWSDNPAEANIYNKIEGKLWLPASPFRTDNSPGKTEGRKWE